MADYAESADANYAAQRARGEALTRQTGAAPCEARKYLGMGLVDGGGGADHLCPHPIAYRFTFYGADQERAAIAYFCHGHAVEVLGIVGGIAHELHPDTDPAECVTANAPLLGGVDVRKYRPRSAARVGVTA